MGHPALELSGHWVELGLSIDTEDSGRVLADWHYMEPRGLWWSNVLNSALPPRRLRADTRPEHQDPVSYMASGCAQSLQLREVAQWRRTPILPCSAESRGEWDLIQPQSTGWRKASQFFWALLEQEGSGGSSKSLGSGRSTASETLRYSPA